MTKVRTRFAPSPTGYLHVGGLRTALFAFLFARKNGGEFVLRIEDTDKARTVEGATENIVQSLKDFHLDFDEGPIFQSERLDKYKSHAEELVEKGAAYYCFCSPERLDALRKEQEAAKKAPKYDKLCLNLSKEEVQAKILAGEKHVIRLNVPEGKRIRFSDLVHGEIDISSNDLDDQVLLKSDGFPTYHLAVVVDDHDMNITHVIRGEEWIPSTPKHILLYSAFGWESPQHAHLPLLLSKTKKKLSKRDGDVAVKDYLEKGYLPEALLNFVALLGWNPKTEQEVFTLDELIEQFSFDKVNKSGAVFDLDKLDWINGLYIRKMALEELFNLIDLYPGHDLKKYPKEFLLKVIKLEQERLKKLSEIGERVKYFFEEPSYDPALLVWKKGSMESARENLQKVHDFIANENDLSAANLEPKLKAWITENNLGTGDVLWPLRVALSGFEASPGPFEIIDAFAVLPDGKNIVLKRIQNATNLL
jgi:glutamyl-tRNA synthetase